MKNKIDLPALQTELQAVGKLAPYLEFEWEFKGLGTFPSKCIVKVWKLHNKIFVLFVDIDEGTTVTNAAKQLVEEVSAHLLDSMLIGNPVEDFIFAETYQRKSHLKKEAVDLVFPKWKDGGVVSVEWVHLGQLIENLDRT